MLPNHRYPPMGPVVTVVNPLSPAVVLNASIMLSRDMEVVMQPPQVSHQTKETLFPHIA